MICVETGADEQDKERYFVIYKLRVRLSDGSLGMEGNIHHVEIW